MNIFKLSDDDFKKHLDEKLGDIDPEILLRQLEECGLKLDTNEVIPEWLKLD